MKTMIMDRQLAAVADKKQPRYLALWIFLIVLFGQYASLSYAGASDAYWYLPTAGSLLLEGNLDLNEYPTLLKASDYYGTILVGDEFYNDFPIGNSLFALPFLVVVKFFYAKILGLDFASLIRNQFLFRLDALIACIASSMTAVAIFFIARRHLAWSLAMFVAIGFVFCTSMWSTASRALWQHGPSALMLTMAVLFLTKPEYRIRDLLFLGFLLSFACMIRPLNLIFAGCCTLYLFSKNWRFAMLYGSALIAFSVPILWMYKINMGVWLPPYFDAQRLGTNIVFWEALAGNLLSPNRGLFTWTPVVLLSLPGYWRYRSEHLVWMLLSVIVLHWIAISSFGHWWAGYSVGPRFFVDMLPLFAYGVIRYLEQAKLRALVILFAIISFFIHAHAAMNPAVLAWNSTPISVDIAPERVWDWFDIQFLRGLIDDF